MSAPNCGNRLTKGAQARWAQVRGARTLALALALTVPLAAGGCSYFEDLFSKEEVPLPGTRVSILTTQRTLAPDENLRGQQILLPAPSPNPDWPQPGGYPNHAMHHIMVPENLSEAWSTDVGQGEDDELRGAFGARNIDRQLY